MGGLAVSTLLAAPGGAAAQTTPNPNQTTQATPYSWPGFHAGGTALSPFYDAAAPAVGTSPTNPGATPYQALSPLYSQLMGTPSGFLLLNADGTLNPGTSVVSEISSFLLGNYNPLAPPPIQTDTTGLTLAYFPNHFADDAFPGGIKSWSAPFTYLTPPSNGLPVTDDNSDSATGDTYPTVAVTGTTTGAVTTASGWKVSFTTTGGFGGVSNTTAADNPITATGNPGYAHALAAATATATATWKFVAPSAATNPAVASLYTVSLHLPNPLVSGDTGYPETRVPDAHYVIKNVTVNPAVTLFDGHISQAETNDPQFLAGPFPIAAGNTITVTLDNSTAASLTNTANTYYVLADSVALTPGSIAGGAASVNGSPTAINSTQFPEIQNAFYLGQMNDASGNRVVDAMPYGNATIGTPDTSTLGVQHSVYQLVYFGRYETIILTDAAGGLVDAAGVASTIPVTEQVGAVYCVNGVTGDIVWRFQTPDVLTPKTVGGATTYTRRSGSQAVFTTPSVARINVLVPQGTTPAETYKPATKLVVVIADDNGQVYCLDAIGSRNGTSNTNVLGAAGSSAQLYNQPIYAPNAPLNTGTTISGTAPHVGTTTTYWVYRPDLTKESQAASANFGKIRAFDSSRDLPQPQAFGTASPTILVDPAKGIDTTTLAPGVLNSALALTSNATVYVGNSNGTLYALDAGGVPVTQAATGSTTYLNSTDPYDTSRYVGIGSFPITAGVPYSLTADGSPVPTAVPVWWFAANGAQSNNADSTANVAITSAPAVRLTRDPMLGLPTAATTSFSATPEVYFATGNDTTNQGRVWAVATTGPVKYATAGGAATALVPGSTGYNSVSRPDWVFPNAFTNTGIGKVRPALGSITGSPVVFTNPDDKTTRVFVAANSSEDDVTPADQGRVWAIRAFKETASFTSSNSISTNAAGEPVWCYPDYYNPNIYAPNNNETLPRLSLGGVAYNTTNNLVPEPLGAFQFATPAIGVVQFPATINYGPAGTTQYAHTDSSANGNGNRTQNDVRGQNVPMLYVGSHLESPDSSNFYALDLDGSKDNERNIFYDANSTNTIPVGTTQGAGGFECSPLLIVNSSLVNATGSNSIDGAAGPGNGGIVFITGTDNNLYELSAVPTSDIATSGSTAPQFPNFILLGGFGPFSSPAAAAFSGTSLGGTATGGGAQDWVYGGDGKLGIARGITPAILTGSGAEGIDFGVYGTGNDVQAPTTVPLQLPLHSYIFKGDVTGDVRGSRDTVNMNQANNVGEALPAFDWGDSAYVRISNVVPPNNFIVDPTTGATTATQAVLDRLVADATAGADKTTVYTNGGPINLQFADITDPGNTNAVAQTDPRSIPTIVLPDTPGLKTNPPGNGFLHRGTAGIQDGDGDSSKGMTSGDVLKDKSGGGTAWIGAFTYPIGNGSNSRDTPGARRRILSATQIAQAYTDNGDGTYKFVGSVTLQATVDSSANQFTTFTPVAGGGRTPTGRRRIAPVDQPTFAILNPLAVQAGGSPLRLGAGLGVAGAVPVVPSQTAGIKTGILGPFGATHSSTALTTDDLQAYANGNRIPRSAADVPLNGVVGGVRTRRSQQTVLVITATGDINDGTSGDNADPQNLNAFPPTGQQNGTTGSGYLTAPNANAPYGPYALNVADRSALGPNGQQIQKVSVQPAAARWQDNSAFSGSNVYGPGAAVNILPWETIPTAGQAGTNTSLDYPDIGASRLSHILMPYPGYNGPLPAAGGNITNQGGTLDPALNATSGNAATRIVYADPLQVQVRVPSYQPANLQVYDQTNTTSQQTTPDQLGMNSIAFPEGYVANETIYVDTNGNHRFDPGEAYRTIRVFTGVPVDMSTTMDTTTIDLGRLPQGFGLNTDSYPALGTFMPYPTTTQLGANAQNPGYVQFFKPLHVSNRGNVNLLNVHLDQKRDIGGTNVPTPLPLLGDTLDAQAFIPAFDTGFALTGPKAPLPDTNGTAAGPFLLRSSLDDDLVTAYGQNPAIAASGAYPLLGATFHKARVGDASPSVLTVPDVPHDNDITSIGSGQPNLYISQNAPPVAVGNALAYPGTQTLGTPTAAASMPYIALAVPQGTPVGTYHQNVRVFEGVDPDGYTNIGVNGNNYVPILPPQYGHTIINPALSNPAGGGTATALPNDRYTTTGLFDTWLLNANNVPLQPASSAAVIKATVTEGRLTNGASKGDLPQVDASPSGTASSGPAPSSNFLPSAFRDPVTGNVSTYWTSSPRIVGGGTPYTLVGASLGFTPGSPGYFNPSTASRWWTPIGLGPSLPATGVNSGISVASGDGGAYAFVQNVTGGGTIPATNNLLCYPVTAGTGALSGTGVPVSTNTSQSTFGTRGLVFNVTNFRGATQGFPDAYPGSTQSPITNNVWSFWYGGARGRSTISYASALSSNVDGGSKTSFGPTAALPIPAGLASVSDPVAIVTYAPDPNDATKYFPVIDVTYTGIAPDGNADIYVSRYRPYYVRKSDNTTLATDANNNNIVALALLPTPAATEQLQATDGNLYYQARDVAWTRAANLDVFVNNTSLNLPNATPTYDRATGTLVYTKLNVTVPGVVSPITTAYVDLARGRVRFAPQLSTPQAVYATFSPQARRITTDSRADTAPVAFMDMSYKPNDLPGAGRVPLDRSWFLWRKSGASGTSTTPTLYYKTQRLSIALHDASGNPITPTLVRTNGVLKPQNLVITDSLSGSVYYDGTVQASADIDVARGRVYFPVISTFAAPFATEGRIVTITIGYTDSNGVYQTRNGYPATIHWLDEPRYQSTGNPNVTTGSPALIAATATDDAAIPIDTVINESNVTAFLDPEVLQRDTPTLAAGATEVPHKVWLFWNSTRNGTADLYYETISPLFSASIGG